MRALENEGKQGVVIVVQGTDLAAGVYALCADKGRLRFGNSAQFLADQIEQLLMRLDARGGDDHPVRTQIFELKGLQRVGVQVVNVGLQPVQRHSQATQAEGRLEDFIRKMFAFI